MAVTQHILDASMTGTIVGPRDGYITRFELQAGPEPALQPDGWFEWPRPHVSFAHGGRLVLRENDGRGGLILAFNPSSETTPVILNASLHYLGGLFLENCPKGARYRLDISDVAAGALRAA